MNLHAESAMRRDMVRAQIVSRGVVDPRVIAAMELVPREEFVPDTHRALAYEDVPLPIEDGQTISQPYIVALMAEARASEGIATFSASFTGDTLDERPYARQVSDLLGTQHHEVTVTPPDFQTQWAALTRSFDAPIPEPPDIAFAALARLAREHVTVVLSGEGADELFAGYPKYEYARLVERTRRLPAGLRRRVFGALERALPASMARPRTMARVMGAGSEAEQFRTWFAPFSATERATLLGNTGRTDYAEAWARASGDVIERMQYVDLHTWLVDNILERGDRTAMAASLELRPPFLDHHVVELAFALPSNLKVRHGTSKWLVREVAARYLPREIFDRPKHGFKVPLDLWFRTGLRDWARDLLTGADSFVGQVMDRRMVQRLLDDHERGRRNDGMRIYTLVGLEVWHHEYFGAPAPLHVDARR